MVRRTVDVSLQHVAGDHISIVDEDSPELDKDEEAEVDIFVEGEQEWEDMVRKGLGVTIYGVERESGVWGGY